MANTFEWLLYPLKLIVNMMKTFVYGCLFIVAIFMSIGIWMVTAHDRRADETKNFAAEQTIYRVDLASNKVTVVHAGDFVQKEVFAKVFTGCSGTGEELKNPTFWDHNWLAEKSDAFQSAYIGASHNVAALKYAIDHAKRGKQVYSFHYVCGEGEGVVVSMPAVYIAFLHRTDESIMDSANAKYNWFTGICMTNCTAADFSPRNDSIYADMFAPQVTKNQDSALAALKATSTPEFWIAAAHANGVTGQDELIASYAEMNQVQLVKVLGHKMTAQEDFNREFTVGLILFTLFIFMVLWGGWKLGKRVFEPKKVQQTR